MSTKPSPSAGTTLGLFGDDEPAVAPPPKPAPPPQATLGLFGDDEPAAPAPAAKPAKPAPKKRGQKAAATSAPAADPSVAEVVPGPEGAAADPGPPPAPPAEIRGYEPPPFVWKPAEKLVLPERGWARTLGLSHYLMGERSGCGIKFRPELEGAFIAVGEVPQDVSPTVCGRCWRAYLDDRGRRGQRLPLLAPHGLAGLCSHGGCVGTALRGREIRPAQR